VNRAVTAPPADRSSAGRSTVGTVLALGLVELRLLARNRTVLLTAVLTPSLLGLYVPWMFAGTDDPQLLAAVLCMQFAVVLPFNVYYAVVTTLVSRRNALVLKRYRTSGTGDLALLTGTLAPPVVLAVVLIVVFLLVDPLFGLPPAAQPAGLVVALVAGLALAVSGGATTTLFTRNAEHAAFTTMPGLVALMVSITGAAFVGPADGPWSLLMLVPGAGVGHVVALAATGGTWTGTSTLLALSGCVLWPLALTTLVRRRFGWQPRAAG